MSVRETLLKNASFVLMCQGGRTVLWASYSDLKAGRRFAFTDGRVLMQVLLSVQNQNSG